MDTTNLSIYIHIPFCKRRCSYCDFTTSAKNNHLIPEYLSALYQEIEYTAPWIEKNASIHSVYIGGGTPSLLLPEQINDLMQLLRSRYSIKANAEITIEANPGTVSKNKLQGYYQSGINRLSFGCQSIHKNELQLLHRLHDHSDTIQAVKWAKQAGFMNISLDLIFGLPGQTTTSWLETLQAVTNLNTQHLSLYALSVEEDTLLHKWVSRGLVTAPDEDLSAEMYEIATDFLSTKNFEQYEISNWFKKEKNYTKVGSPNRMSLHNLQYWRNLPYLGFGAGAHGFIHQQRYANQSVLTQYIQSVSNNTHKKHKSSTITFPAAISQTKVDMNAEIDETMMLGLRLTKEGVSNIKFQKRFGATIEGFFDSEITELLQLGLIEWTDNQERLRLTKQGRLLGNQVFMRFIR